MKQEEVMRDFRRKLRLLESEIELALSGETNCCGITVAQCHLLMETEFLKKANLGELSEALELDKSTASRAVDSLYTSGLIDRSEDSGNRRKVSIQLTDAGKAKADTINSLCNQSYTRVFDHIPEDKHTMVIEAVALLGQAMRKTRKEAKETCCKKT